MITIRRQWLLVLTLTAVLAVSINSAVFASLINGNLISYAAESYSNHVTQIEQLAENTLIDNVYSQRQLSVQFESHLDDPIVSIKLYDTEGRLMASAENDVYGMPGMMNRMMHSNTEEVDSYSIMNGDVVLGQLHITRYSTLANSLMPSLFRSALIKNSLVSFVIVLAVLSLVGIFVSRRLSRDLAQTATQALNVDLGNRTAFNLSKVKEISIIQSSLNTLSSRLQIRHMSRKRLVDEIVHQTRTPLTILKTHLEGFEDGIITMTDEEIKICQEQIESITVNISNLRLLLEADRPTDAVKTEEIDLNQVLSQIVEGLKVQFEKKNIRLQLLNHQKVKVITDKYKLSQCLYNLLTNAYKFTNPQGAVLISYESSGTELTIRVKDTGIGIDPADIERLFDAYYRGGNAVNTDGEGLGLYVVKENLCQLGGSIRVQSKPGSGSEFIITIPITITPSES